VVALRPRLVIAITEATPMMMPRSERKERMRLFAKLPKASRM
jgi:hypothetical protein